MRAYRTFFLLVTFAPIYYSQSKFPDWKVATIGLVGSWERAQSVVVGDVTNITPVGSQKISNPPRPVSPSVSEIYWCEGDFNALSAIKGSLPARGKRFLWAAIRPGCGLEWFFYGYAGYGDPVTRVWFIREEGGYIRPAVDGGGFFFASFHVNWKDVRETDDLERFASLVISPEAVGRTPAEFASILNRPAELACLVVGRTRCVKQLKSLAATEDARLHESVCDYLESQLHESCPAQK